MPVFGLGVHVLIALFFAIHDARREFIAAVARFGSFEIRAEFALWAVQIGDVETALGLQREIEHSLNHWNKHTRSLNKPLMKRLDAAYGAFQK